MQIHELMEIADKLGTNTSTLYNLLSKKNIGEDLYKEIQGLYKKHHKDAIEGINSAKRSK